VICVDTSVWVDALRQPSAAAGQRLRTLLDEESVLLPIPVRMELLSGASRGTLVWLRDDLDALPQLEPSSATWRRLETWLPQAIAAGQRFGFADWLIAALAAEHAAPVWSLDHAFQRMAELGFITLCLAQ
jgi:predicted nucleic acid-binding protein